MFKSTLFYIYIVPFTDFLKVAHLLNKSLFWLTEWQGWWGGNNRATWQGPGAWHPANRDQKTGGEQTTGQTADEGRHLKRAVHAGDTGNSLETEIYTDCLLAFTYGLFLIPERKIYFV